jgi:hypothetical protein
MRIALLAVLPFAVGSACDRGVGGGYQNAVADSAGIKIVTVRPPLDAGSLRRELQSPPDLDLGVGEGSAELMFAGVIGALRLSGGRIVVGNSLTKELRFFESDGRFVTSVGRDGEGPGEFRRLDYLGTLGADTIFAYDRQLRRISLFRGSGALIESRIVARNPAVVGRVRPFRMVGWQVTGTDDNPPGIYTLPIEYGQLDLPGGEYHRMGEIASREIARVRYSGRTAIVHRPFGRETDLAAGGIHFFVLESTDDRSIRVYGATGALLRVLRLAIQKEPVDAATVEGWVETWLLNLPWNSEPTIARYRQGFQAISSPDSVPVFRSLEVDTSGNVCAERYPLRWDTPLEYWCLSPEGELQRILRVPAGLSRPGPHPDTDPQLEIGTDHVLGVWQDSVGVQHVRMYAIKPER